MMTRYPQAAPYRIRAALVRGACPGAGRRATLLGAAALGGCSAPGRGDPVPIDRIRQASVLGIANERFTITDPADLPRITQEFNQAGRRQRRRFGLGPRAPLPPSHVIAFSRGAENGAFGAGLVCGWTAHGTRPEFNAVTGVSTGALIAPLVFAGPHRDGQIEALFNGIDARDILHERGLLAALSEDALADSAPLARLIARHFDEALLREIAQGYADGRQLVIATTNLDLPGPVGWNLGAIAASGHPGALALARRILLASAAVPGLLPPVMIDVTVNGRPHQEMHVDGGAYAQAFLYPPALGASRAARIRQGLTPAQVSAYVVRNGRARSAGHVVPRRAFAIAMRGIATLLNAAATNDIFRIHHAARRDGIVFHLAEIGEDFTEREVEPFDQAYMRALFAYAHAKARNGFPWRRAPSV
jgi:predicted acylesterase/phospholipase RssA